MQTYSYSHYRLKRLHYWLTLEGISGGLSIGFAYLTFGVVFAGLVVVALVGALFVLKTLYWEKRLTWILLFVLMVGVPFFLAFIPVENVVIRMILPLFPLLMFYVYCWMLRHAVGQWLLDVEWNQERKREASKSM
jgi:hypothetical protein